MEFGIASIFVSGAVVGFVEFIRRCFKQEWEGAIIILGAALIGGFAGYYGVDALTVPTGIVAGLFASGLVTVVQKNGTGTRY